ncbi:PREDICTED: uncharacterized protein LOC109150557 [Ipomoea nil]|uniref:uncharacterized protein LOC109150557 n=1 Tax=Ipomoea nil TaxID=35883 RepID=UPI000900A26D|nr:PREDICTED: uncharacterized protein LOC109150557 [Ipomoea nil]
MENSFGAGCMAVFAVSGTVVLLAVRLHNHLTTDFMNKIEAKMETTTTTAGKDQERRKVKFSGDDHHLKRSAAAAGRNRAVVGGETLESMPPNWQALYKGIIQYNKAAHRRLN